MTSKTADIATKRQIFVREMAKHGNHVDAARAAGYSRPTTDGIRLLRLTAVRNAIEAEHRRIEAERPVDAQYFIDELLAIASECKIERPHIAVTALMGAAKIAGVIRNNVETQEVSSPQKGVPEHWSPLGAKLDSLSPDGRQNVLCVLYEVQHEASKRDPNWIDGARDSVGAWAALPADLRERVLRAVNAAEEADQRHVRRIH